MAERQRDRVEGYIGLAVEAGATGGCWRRAPRRPAAGWYVEPTVLAGVDNTMRVAREEIFGPVLCLLPYDDEDDAVRIANDSPYGLSGGGGALTPPGPRRGPPGAHGQHRGQRRLPAFPRPLRRLQRSPASAAKPGPEGLRSYLEPCSIGVP